MRIRPLARAVVGSFALALALGSVPASAQTLFWVETNFSAPLWRRSLSDGSGAFGAALGPGTLPEGVAFATSLGKVYWVESSYTGARVRRANGDATGAQVLVSGGSSFRGLALHEAAGKMYWTSSNQVEGAKIRRANLDGSNLEVVVDFGTSVANPRGLAIDPVAGKMYWADVGTGEIRRANLDGTALELVLVASAPYGVAVDPAAGYLYWSHAELGNISRTPIAGGTSLKVKSGLSYPTYLALDPATATLYWIEGTAGAAKLRRGPAASGGTIEDLVPLSSYGGLAFTPASIVDMPAIEPVTAFTLGAVTPNPASGPAHVAFALPQASRIRLDVIDVRGRHVATLVDGDLPAGRHGATWSGRTDTGPAAAGIYFLRLIAPGVELVQRTVRLP